MSQEWEEHLDSLYQLLEDEIFHLHLLAGEVKKESEYLKKGSLESLMEPLYSLEVHTAALRKIQESIQKAIGRILELRQRPENEKTLSGLITALPSQESRKIRGYQSTLTKLKTWISRMNGQNQSFLKESLAYGQDLLSLLTGSFVESPLYVQNGQKKSSVPLPHSLNRKV